jgi:hypothetical protein
MTSHETLVLNYLVRLENGNATSLDIALQSIETLEVSLWPAIPYGFATRLAYGSMEAEAAQRFSHLTFIWLALRSSRSLCDIPCSYPSRGMEFAGRNSQDSNMGGNPPTRVEVARS